MVAASLVTADLTELAGDSISTLSRGHQQRVAIAEMLVKAFDFVLLDEPLFGLDPIATAVFVDAIQQLKQNKVTVVIASHLLKRVPAICNRVALLKDGHIVLMGTPAHLDAHVPATKPTLTVEAAETDIASAVRAIEGVQKVTRKRGGTWKVTADRDVASAAAPQIINKGGALTRFVRSQSSMLEISTHHLNASLAAS
jgi:ABC-type multidrug transport system ATPase subunit